MRDYSSQKNEIETIKPRTITVNLSDADVKRLAEKSGEGGLTISELLENFIGDLVDGTYSNGSDERMYAEQWQLHLPLRLLPILKRQSYYANGFS